jgi:hypothetical protein
MDYDICIIGAGIAGLYCALELSKKQSTNKLKLCILEKYPYIGGRTSTFHDKARGLQWEAGAGRVHKSHSQVIKLMNKYGLTQIPISSKIDWRPSADHSETVNVESYVNNLALTALDPKTLRTNTLNTLISDVAGKNTAKDITDRYEYRSEFDTLRADLGLYSLGHELGDNQDFFIIKEGFSALVGGMKRDIEAAGVEILREYIVTDIEKGKDGYIVNVQGRPAVKATKVIVALTRDAVAELPCFKDLPILKQVKMRPLVRIYAVFPKVKGLMWFEGIQKFVCPKPVRYVLPIDPGKGTIMISYTDGEDAEYWLNIMKKPNHMSLIQAEIMDQIRNLFPEKHVPEPTFLKIHPWSDGCSYWLPGDYDFNKVSKASVRPLPKSMPYLYMCGESWAYEQAWVKCAIDQAQHALDAFNADSA